MGMKVSGDSEREGLLPKFEQAATCTRKQPLFMQKGVEGF